MALEISPTLSGRHGSGSVPQLRIALRIHLMRRRHRDHAVLSQSSIRAVPPVTFPCTFRCGTLAWAADAASTRQASRRREGQLMRADECRRHVAHLDAAERARCFEA